MKIFQLWSSKKLYLTLGALCLFIFCASVKPFTDITPHQAQNLIEKHARNNILILIDVRTPAEFAAGHLNGALNLNLNAPDFADRLNELDKTKIYLVYCIGGVRSARAMQIMQKKGFRQVYNLSGGLSKWQAENRAL